MFARSPRVCVSLLRARRVSSHSQKTSIRGRILYLNTLISICLCEAGPVLYTLYYTQHNFVPDRGRSTKTMTMCDNTAHTEVCLRLSYHPPLNNTLKCTFYSESILLED